MDAAEGEMMPRAKIPDDDAGMGLEGAQVWLEPLAAGDGVLDYVAGVVILVEAGAAPEG